MWKMLAVVTVILIVAKVAVYNTPAQFFIDVPLLTFGMLLLIKYRKNLADKIKKICLPKFVLYLLAAVPFIILEENINCAQSGCKVIPDTLPILLIFVFVLGIFTKLFKARSIKIPLLFLVVGGVLFELFAGGLRGGVVSPIGLFFMVWTMWGYAFLVIVPLTVLTE